MPIDKILSLTLKSLRLRVFENRDLTGLFVSKKEEGTGGWRKLHNEELLTLYFSPNIIRIIKSRKIKWGEHAESLGRVQIHIKMLSINLTTWKI
jgi:hypothetical protein